LFCGYFFLYLLPQSIKDIQINKIVNRLFSVVFKYIIVGFSVLYSFIIYIYSIKILILKQWPTNQVCLFLGMVFIMVFVSYLFTEKNKKILRLYRIYLASLLPLMIMYFISIGMRINQYGLTEIRILSVVVGLFIVGFSLYLIINKNIQIRYILMAILVAILLLNIGPLNMYDLTTSNQFDRYKQYLKDENIVVDNKVVVHSIKLHEYYPYSSTINEKYEFRAKTVYLLRRMNRLEVLSLFPSDFYVSVMNTKSIDDWSDSQIGRDLSDFIFPEINK
jgi:hypothetical protein